ncbi:MAG TPA: MBL fold metallo-hydrolase [Puia sp.]|jgi:glyoxylase-like metal-dependent hydrolase (beta-lactamase superfamily II)|nr:MBL fold metallo-hydrolase [Puia sp.]
MKIVPLTYLSTHYYLLITDKATLLADAGWPGTIGKFLHLLRNIDISLESITHFFVTHYHPDHAGLTQELQDLGIKLIVLDLQLPAIPLLKQWIKPETNWKEIHLSKDTIILTAGDSRSFLNRLGLDGRFVHTPGHSDDSISLVLDTGEAFIGDLPIPGYPTGDNEEIRSSYAILLSLGVSTLFPSHGPTPVPFNP